MRLVGHLRFDRDKFGIEPRNEAEVDESRIIIPGRAKTKERPRQGRGGRFFTPRKTREYEELVAWHCRASKVRLGSASVEVLIELWANRPLRGDLDNYAKGVLDGLIKGGVLDDDRQVSRLVVQPMINPDEEERVVVILRGSE